MTSIIHTKKGEQIIVPSELLADLSQFSWYTNKYGYAVRVVVNCSRSESRKTGKRRLGAEFIHRRILGLLRGRQLTSDEHVDHINRNPLDNSASNLRIVSKRGYENASNQGVRRDSTTGVKGVNWHSRDRKYSAKIQHNGKRIWLGYFVTLEEAADAYNEHARRLHGEYAFINKIGNQPK